MENLWLVQKDPCLGAWAEHLIASYRADSGVVEIKLVEWGDVNTVDFVKSHLGHENRASHDVVDGYLAVRDEREVTSSGRDEYTMPKWRWLEISIGIKFINAQRTFELGLG